MQPLLLTGEKNEPQRETPSLLWLWQSGPKDGHRFLPLAKYCLTHTRIVSTWGCRVSQVGGDSTESQGAGELDPRARWVSILGGSKIHVKS